MSSTNFTSSDTIENGRLALPSTSISELKTMTLMPTTTTTTTTKDSNNTNSMNRNCINIGNTSVGGDARITHSATTIVNNFNLGNIMPEVPPAIESNPPSSFGPEILGSTTSLPSELTPIVPRVMQNGAPSTRHISLDGFGFDNNSGRQELDDFTLESNSRSRQIQITEKNIKHLLSKDMNKTVANYMNSFELFEYSFTIPLWKPSPSLGTIQEVENWPRNVHVGDVGVFDDDGGFSTYFNIFETEEQNRRRRYIPPQGFVPYHKSLSDIIIKTIPHRQFGFAQTKVLGFRQEHNEKDGRLMLKMPLPSILPEQFAAIHMKEGFVRFYLRGHDKKDILNYCKRNQTGWYKSLDKTLDGRPLVIITTSYRTQDFALASTKTFKAKTTIKLAQRTKNGHEAKFWESADNSVITQNGPSEDHTSRIESYLKITNVPNRLELDECHVVAVEAFCLQEESAGWKPLTTLGGKSRRSNATARRSVFSFLTLKGRR